MLSCLKSFFFFFSINVYDCSCPIFPQQAIMFVPFDLPVSDVWKGLLNYVRSIQRPFCWIPRSPFPQRKASKISYLQKQHCWFQTLSCCPLKAIKLPGSSLSRTKPAAAFVAQQPRSINTGESKSREFTRKSSATNRNPFKKETLLNLSCSLSSFRRRVPRWTCLWFSAISEAACSVG